MLRNKNIFYSKKYLATHDLCTDLLLVVQVGVEPDAAGAGGAELDLGQAARVAGREVDVELEHAAGVGSVRRARDHCLQQRNLTVVRPADINIYSKKITNNHDLLPDEHGGGEAAGGGGGGGEGGELQRDPGGGVGGGLGHLVAAPPLPLSTLLLLDWLCLH